MALIVPYYGVVSHWQSTPIGQLWLISVLISLFFMLEGRYDFHLIAKYAHLGLTLYFDQMGNR